jgi:hypothetical protein
VIEAIVAVAGMQIQQQRARMGEQQAIRSRLARESEQLARAAYKPFYRQNAAGEWVIDQERSDAAFEEVKRKCAALAEVQRAAHAADAWSRSALAPEIWSQGPLRQFYRSIVPVDLQAEHPKPPDPSKLDALKSRMKAHMASVSDLQERLGVRASGALRWRVDDPLYARRAAIAKRMYDSAQPTTAGPDM